MSMAKSFCMSVLGGLFLLCLPCAAVTVSGDLNGNGLIDQEDALAAVGYWKAKDLSGDIQLDGNINAEDLFLFQQQWGDYTIGENPNVILHFQNSNNPALHNALTDDLQVASQFKSVTAPAISNAFITFATATMKAKGGPPFEIFSATAGDPARRIDLMELDDLGQILGGINFPASQANWIRLHILQGFPYTYIVGEDEGIYELKVPSNKFRLISPGAKITIATDTLNILSIDMDVNRSIVHVSGTNSILKPVVKLFVNTTEVDDATGGF